MSHDIGRFKGRGPFNGPRNGAPWKSYAMRRGPFNGPWNGAPWAVGRGPFNGP